MSLPQENLLLRFPIQSRHPGLPEAVNHDFVIDATWRNKLKDRPN
jgi:hypothetical protein